MGCGLEDSYSMIPRNKIIEKLLLVIWSLTMTLKARKEYLEAIYLRYKNATKSEKSKILDEFCQVCHISRKHAVSALL